MFRSAVTIILVCLWLALPAPARAVELVFWTSEIHEDRLVVINFLARAFEAMQDEVTVKVISVDENEMYARMHKAWDEDKPPHLVGTGSELLVSMAETGCLDRAEASRIIRRIGLERFYPGTLSMLAATGGDQWYGVPFHGWVQGIWYRADWFEEAGLAPPRTWPDILAAAKRFTDPEKGRYGILVGTADDHYTTQVFSQIAASNGGAMFRADGSVVFNRLAMEQALEFYAELAKYTPPGPQSWRARDYFLQGKLAMLFYSTFIMDDLALEQVAADSLTGDNFSDLTGAAFNPNLVQNVRMVPFVQRERKSGYGMINGFGVSRSLSAEERDAVERFLAFLYQPAQYVTWLHMAPGGMLPVLRDVAESAQFLADPSGIFRRYGRSKIVGIINGLASIRTFGMVGGKRQPAASLVYTAGVIPRMVKRTVFESVPAPKSLAEATAEIREIVRGMKAD